MRGWGHGSAGRVLAQHVQGPGFSAHLKQQVREQLFHCEEICHGAVFPHSEFLGPFQMWFYL